MKNKVFIAILVSLFAVAAVAAGVTYYNVSSRGTENAIVKIDKDGKADETVTVSELTLNPSETKDDVIYLTCEADGEFDVSLEFIEKYDGGLKSFVTVKITSAGNTVYDGMLDALLTDKAPVTFKSGVAKKGKTELVISYSMPESVGNEAKNTSSRFDIHVTVDKK